MLAWAGSLAAPAAEQPVSRSPQAQASSKLATQPKQILKFSAPYAVKFDADFPLLGMRDEAKPQED